MTVSNKFRYHFSNEYVVQRRHISRKNLSSGRKIVHKIDVQKTLNFRIYY